MVAVDGQGLPIGIKLSSATPHESKLIESTLDTVRIPRIGAGRPRTKIQRLIYDRAADYPSLRRRLLEQRGIDLICPHRKICKQKMQDGRKLARYKKRWKVERTNAWLLNFRLVATRYDKLISSYFAFVLLACIMIVLRRL